MERGKIGEKLINLVDLLVGRIKGGLGVVGTISCAVFGSITGSACATLSCIGSIMFPRLEEAGYPRGIAAAVMSNASLLGMLIPPNSTLIIFAWIGGQSILACFLATVIPGIIMTALICLVNCWLVKDNPNVKVTEPVHGKEKFQLFKEGNCRPPCPHASGNRSRRYLRRDHDTYGSCSGSSRLRHTHRHVHLQRAYAARSLGFPR